MSAPTQPSGGSPERSSLRRLRALLLDEGGLIADLVGSPTAVHGSDGDGDDHGADHRAGGSADSAAAARSGESAGRPAERDGVRAPSPAQLAASGPRAAGHREDYELLIETIYEGYLLHYGTPRVALTADGDLALLAGDRLYALGLARLVALGDVAAVAELADTITLSALSQGADAPELADAIWAAGARAVGWGSSEAHRRAKELVLAGDPEAIEAMRTNAAALAASP
jgi:hypothetical protein